MEKFRVKTTDTDSVQLIHVDTGSVLIETPPFDVYICSALSAPTQEGIRANMMFARTKMKNLRKQGILAFAPHAWLPLLVDDNDPGERQVALDFGLKCLEHAKEMYVYTRYGRISDGMKGEIARAAWLGIPITVHEYAFSNLTTQKEMSI